MILVYKFAKTKLIGYLYNPVYDKHYMISSIFFHAFFHFTFQQLWIVIATMFPLMRKRKLLTCFVQGLLVRAEQAQEAKSSEHLANVLYHIFNFYLIYQNFSIIK